MFGWLFFGGCFYFCNCGAKCGEFVVGVLAGLEHLPD